MWSIHGACAYRPIRPRRYARPGSARISRQRSGPESASANRLKSNPNPTDMSMPSKTEKLLSLLERPAGHPGAEDRRCRQMPCRWPARWRRGGLPAIEITLRTPDALEAIRRVAGGGPRRVVGAGTILNAGQFDEAAAAGSQIHRQPRHHPGGLRGGARQRRCRCCPAPSRRARSWPRGRPGSIS